VERMRNDRAMRRLAVRGRSCLEPVRRRREARAGGPVALQKCSKIRLSYINLHNAVSLELDDCNAHGGT
jgi:hypothetical protein